MDFLLKLPISLHELLRQFLLILFTLKTVKSSKEVLYTPFNFPFSSENGKTMQSADALKSKLMICKKRTCIFCQEATKKGKIQQLFMNTREISFKRSIWTRSFHPTHLIFHFNKEKKFFLLLSSLKQFLIIEIFRITFAVM